MYPEPNQENSLCLGPYTLRCSTPEQEGKGEMSKWLEVQVLLDCEEMRALLEVLEGAAFFSTNRLVRKSEGLISPEEFMLAYSYYITSLKEGRIPDPAGYRVPFFASVTRDIDAVYSMEIAQETHIVKIARPVIQMQSHTFNFDAEQKKVRPMVMGPDNVHWGIQFSYPQLFHNPETHSVEATKEEELFPNTALFKSLQRWVRHNTRATPLLWQGRQVNVPIRLGKRCFSWIQHHPGLNAKNLSVVA